MKNVFKHTSSSWVRYDSYEWRTSNNGILYLTASKNANPDIYDPMKDMQSLVLDALTIGHLCMGKESDETIQNAIFQFALKYGLLGFMTALPTTPSFMDYEAVYLPKNHFLKEETMRTENYLALFFPLDQLDVVKRGIESTWNIENDPTMAALAMTFSNKPMALNMSFQRGYAERYDWLKQQFTDWAFTFATSILYYEDYDSIDEDSRDLYRQSMAAFEGIAPTYHIALLDRPTIIWDFHSLLLGTQMMFSFMLTDEKQPLRLCKQCTNPFVAASPDDKFCGPECASQYQHEN